MIKKIITLTIILKLTSAYLLPLEPTKKTTNIQKMNKQEFLQKKKIQKINQKNFLNIFLNADKDYDRCLEGLEDTLKQIVEIVRVILKKDYSELLPIIMKFGNDLFSNIECFINAQSFKKNLSFGYFFGDKKQCEFDLIVEAFGHLKSGFNYLKELNLEKVVKEYKSFLQSIEDMKHC